MCVCVYQREGRERGRGGGVRQEDDVLNVQSCSFMTIPLRGSKKRVCRPSTCSIGGPVGERPAMT